MSIGTHLCFSFFCSYNFHPGPVFRPYQANGNQGQCGDRNARYIGIQAKWKLVSY